MLQFCRFGEPRTIILHKGKKGFGFVLRGAKGTFFFNKNIRFYYLIFQNLRVLTLSLKASSPLMERETNDAWPSQYLEDVGKGGVADLAGLKKGDYLLEASPFF